MQIVQVPRLYSPVTEDVVFTIEAEPTEIVDVDIYDHAGTQVIGRKRFTGAETYDVNVCNYARQQVDVVPVVSSRNQFVVPPGRNVNVKIKCGDVSRVAVVISAMKVVNVYGRLSKSPARVRITPTQVYEMAMITNAWTLTAEVELRGSQGVKTVVLLSKAMAQGLAVLHVNMKDVDRKLKAESLGMLADYRSMVVRIKNEDECWCEQEFDIMPNRESDVRICWWNSSGQIDYYTMRQVKRRTFKAQKQRVYTPEGYRIVGNQAEVCLEMVSDYESEEGMMWLEEIVAAPRVWMERDGVLVPMEVVSSTVVTNAERLSRLEVGMVERKKAVYQSL